MIPDAKATGTSRVRLVVCASRVRRAKSAAIKSGNHRLFAWGTRLVCYAPSSGFFSLMSVKLMARTIITVPVMVQTFMTLWR